MNQQIENQLAELQTKIAFQEDTIEQLNQALTSQQKQIEALEFTLKHVVERIKNQQPSHIADLSEETPPPHY